MKTAFAYNDSKLWNGLPGSMKQAIICHPSVSVVSLLDVQFIECLFIVIIFLLRLPSKTVTQRY